MLYDLYEKEKKRVKESEETITLKLTSNLLKAKCPICQAIAASNPSEITICPNCLTLYHVSCIKDVIKSVPNDKCWVCNQIELKTLPLV